MSHIKDLTTGQQLFPVYRISAINFENQQIKQMKIGRITERNMENRMQISLTNIDLKDF